MSLRPKRILILLGLCFSFHAAHSQEKRDSLSSASLPRAIAVDALENIYVLSGQRVWSRNAASGSFRPIAGRNADKLGNGGFSGDRDPALKAALDFPRDLTVDAAGRLYIADTGNHKIRRVEKGVLETVAGMTVREDYRSPPTGFGDGAKAPRARLQLPEGVAVDPAGNLYIADTVHHLIRKVDAQTQTITSIGGTEWNSPSKIVVSGNDDLFVLDGSSGERIRKISAKTSRAVTVVATSVYAARSAKGAVILESIDGDPESILDLDVDATGNLYVLLSSSRIKKINRNAKSATLVAGNGKSGFSGDGGPAVRASLGEPENFAIGPSGSIYIADTENARIRRVDAAGIITTLQKIEE